jgi:hypothetical protein
MDYHQKQYKHMVNVSWGHIYITNCDCVYGEKAIGVWIQQSQGWQVNNPRGRASHVMKHIYIINFNILYTKTFGIVYLLIMFFEWFLFVHNFSMIFYF